MSNTIQTDTRHHMTSDEVAKAIREARGTESEIPDGAALAIASWWQAPGGHGATFAQLASTGKVDRTALLDAIASEYSGAKRQGGSAALELDMLATWVLNHPSVTD